MMVRSLEFAVNAGEILHGVVSLKGEWIGFRRSLLQTQYGRPCTMVGGRPCVALRTPSQLYVLSRPGENWGPRDS